MKRYSRLLIWAGVIVSVAVGLFARWYRLDRLSFWWDELFSIENAHYPLRYLPSLILYQATQPPLFPVLAKVWVRFFGETETAVRVLPAILGSLSILATYWMARVFWGRAAGLWAAALISLHHMAIYHSQEFLNSILLYGLAAANLALAGTWLLEKRRGFALSIFLALGNTLLIYTHYFGLFILVLENLMFLAGAGFGIDPKERRRWWLIQSIPFAFLSPWMPGLAFHAFHLSQSHLQTDVQWGEVLAKMGPLGGVPAGDHSAWIFSATTLLFWLLFAGGIWIAARRAGALNFRRTARPLSKGGGVPGWVVVLLLGGLGIPLSWFLFSAWREGPFALPVPWGRLAFEGALCYAAACALIAGGGFFSRRIEVAGSAENPDRWVAALLVASFPLGAMFVMELAGRTFRPVYELRNMLFVLPCLVATVAGCLAGIRGGTIRALLMVALVSALVTHWNDAPSFRPRQDYRGLVREFERQRTLRGTRPVMATITSTAELPLRYYARDVEQIFCGLPCAEKLRNRREIFWVFQSPAEAGEEERFKEIERDIGRGRPVLEIGAAGLRGELIRYGVGPALRSSPAGRTGAIPESPR